MVGPPSSWSRDLEDSSWQPWSVERPHIGHLSSWRFDAYLLRQPAEPIAITRTDSSRPRSTFDPIPPG